MNAGEFYYGVDGGEILGPRPLAEIRDDVMAGRLLGAVGVSRWQNGPWTPLAGVPSGQPPNAQVTHEDVVPVKRERGRGEPPKEGQASRTVGGYVEVLGWLGIVLGFISIAYGIMAAFALDPAYFVSIASGVSGMIGGLLFLVIAEVLGRLRRISERG